MVASSDPRWLQGNFNSLVGLFGRVGLQKNVGKTVGMVCNPCQAAENMFEATHGRTVTGEGPTYREWLKGRVSCSEYGEFIAAGYLTIHLMSQHGRVAETRQRWRTRAAGDGPRTFHITLPAMGGPQSCPVEGCPGRVAMRKAMQVHFLHRHVLDTVIILEEGKLPHPRCSLCDMIFLQKALNGRHLDIAKCER